MTQNIKRNDATHFNPVNGSGHERYRWVARQLADPLLPDRERAVLEAAWLVVQGLTEPIAREAQW